MIDSHAFQPLGGAPTFCGWQPPERGLGPELMCGARAEDHQIKEAHKMPAPTLIEGHPFRPGSINARECCWMNSDEVMCGAFLRDHATQEVYTYGSGSGDIIATEVVPVPVIPAEKWHTAAVDHPDHYTSHPSGVECIQIVEHMGFNLGNVIKYVWRADAKGNALEDLHKAAWYIQREIERRRAAP